MHAAVLGLLLGVLVLLQGSPPATFKTLTPRAKDARLGKSFLFLVDQSGSMIKSRTRLAIEVTLSTAAQPVDEMEACLISFTSDCLRWSNGWVRLPDKDAVDDMGHWLSVFKSNWATTRLIPGLALALKENKRELTIVIVSDGQFYVESRAMLLSVLETGQKAREERGLPRALIICMAVGKERAAKKLQALGKAGKGGCYLWKIPKKEKE